MKVNINPVVGLAILVIAAVLILALMYRHSFSQPASGSIESMSPAERASLYKSLAPPKPGGAPGAASTPAPSGSR